MLQPCLEYCIESDFNDLLVFDPSLFTSHSHLLDSSLQGSRSSWTTTTTFSLVSPESSVAPLACPYATCPAIYSSLTLTACSRMAFGCQSLLPRLATGSLVYLPWLPDCEEGSLRQTHAPITLPWPLTSLVLGLAWYSIKSWRSFQASHPRPAFFPLAEYPS